MTVFTSKTEYLDGFQKKFNEKFSLYLSLYLSNSTNDFFGLH